MSTHEHDMTRMRRILRNTSRKAALEDLKLMLRNWRSAGAPGQDALNRAIIRALNEAHERLDALLRI